VPFEFDSLSPKRTQLNSLFMGFAVLTLLVGTQDEWWIEGASPAADSVTGRAETT
jgi:hypothetical protein